VCGLFIVREVLFVKCNATLNVAWHHSFGRGMVDNERLLFLSLYENIPVELKDDVAISEWKLYLYDLPVLCRSWRTFVQT
jgi:hypothetical protein